MEHEDPAVVEAEPAAAAEEVSAAEPEAASGPAPALPRVVLAAIRDRVIVHRDPPREMAAAGIEAPQIAREETLSGTVLSVGMLVKELASGDRVRFGTHAGYPLPEEGDPYLLILREDEVMAKERLFAAPTEG